MQVAPDSNDRAIFLDRARRPEESEPLFLAALAGHQEILGPRHPTVARLYDNLGTHLAQAGHPDAALPLLEAALDVRRGFFGPRHADVARSLGHWCDVARTMNDATRAEEARCESLETANGTGEPYDEEAGTSAFKLARGALLRGEAALARGELKLALEALASLADLRAAQGRASAASELRQRTLAVK